jgi:hypothetical protein
LANFETLVGGIDHIATEEDQTLKMSAFESLYGVQVIELAFSGTRE